MFVRRWRTHLQILVEQAVGVHGLEVEVLLPLGEGVHGPLAKLPPETTLGPPVLYQPIGGEAGYIIIYNKRVSVSETELILHEI